jgi:hypothetical protein
MRRGGLLKPLAQVLARLGIPVDDEQGGAGAATALRRPRMGLLWTGHGVMLPVPLRFSLIRLTRTATAPGLSPPHAGDL